MRRKARPLAHARPTGFTLIELLIVIAVIVILLALLMPAIQAARAKQRMAQCASNQHQIYLAWVQAAHNRAASNNSTKLDTSNWPDLLSPYLENAKKVYYCPDDVKTTSISASYGFNHRAWRLLAGGAESQVGATTGSIGDNGRIVLLDFKYLEVQVVGSTLAFLNAAWPQGIAPRHFQKENVTFYDGHTAPYEPKEIDPRYCNFYVQYWRPQRDFGMTLSGCLTPGQPTTDIPGTFVPPTGTGTATASSSSTSASSSSSTTASSSTSSSTTATSSTGPDPCVPDPPPQVATKGAVWLTKHQFSDGSWSLIHSTHPDCNAQCPNDAKDGFPGHPAATGLALLALLGTGSTATSGPYADNICRGTIYLMNSVAPDGSLIETNRNCCGGAWMYGQLLGTLALTEVLRSAEKNQQYGCNPNPACSLDPDVLKQKIQLICDYLAAVQPARGGWRYDTSFSPADMSNMVWAGMLLKNAQFSGINVSASTMFKFNTFLNDCMYNPVTYNGVTLGDYAYAPGSHHNFAMTACGLAASIFVGGATLESHTKVTTFTSDPAIYTPQDGASFYNMHVAQLLHLAGGVGWNNWKSTVNAHYAASQASGGHIDGSWFFPAADGKYECCGGLGPYGGRLYCTTMAMLTMPYIFGNVLLGEGGL